MTKLPNQQDHSDAKKLRILLRIFPAHFAALDETLRHEPGPSDRKLLDETKFPQSSRRDQWVRWAMEEMKATIEVPCRWIASACGLPKTEAFVEAQRPQV